MIIRQVTINYHNNPNKIYTRFIFLFRKYCLELADNMEYLCCLLNECTRKCSYDQIRAY